MLRNLLIGRLAKRMPIFKVIAIAEIALLARTHVRHLDGAERRRLASLAAHGRSLTPAEKEELRGLVAKLDLRLLAGSAADKLSPVPLPRAITGVAKNKSRGRRG